jgi:hypothetical protein
MSPTYGLPPRLVLWGCLAVLAVGCASAGLVLKRPIEKQCATARLQQCDDIVNGVLMYVEGNESGARSTLEDVARANQPEKLRKFAEGLQTVTDLPGVSEYAGPIKKVCRFLAPPAPPQIANAELHGGGGAPGGPSKACPPEPPKIAEKPAPEPWNDPTKTDGGTVILSVQTGAGTCHLGVGFSIYDPFDPKGTGATAGICLAAIQGPITITDLHAGGACKADLFVLGGSLSYSRWLVQSPANSPLHITGARLAAREGEVITVGMAGPGQGKSDLRCAVTWAGWRP